jgi:hypothetical protein
MFLRATIFQSTLTGDHTELRHYTLRNMILTLHVHMRWAFRVKPELSCQINYLQGHSQNTPPPTTLLLKNRSEWRCLNNFYLKILDAVLAGARQDCYLLFPVASMCHSRK